MSRMITRSCKSNQIKNKTKRDICCFICRLPGHNCNNCDSSIPDDLHKDTLETFVYYIKYNLIHDDSLNIHIDTINRLARRDLILLAIANGISKTLDIDFYKRRFIEMYIQLAQNQLNADIEFMHLMNEKKRKEDEYYRSQIINYFQEVHEDMQRMSDVELRNYIYRFGEFLRNNCFRIHRPKDENIDLDEDRIKLKFILTFIHKNSQSNDTEYTCPICLENNLDIKKCVTTNCNHKFCNDCMRKYILSIKDCNDMKCAYCKQEVLFVESQDKEIFDKLVYTFGNFE